MTDRRSFKFFIGLLLLLPVAMVLAIGIGSVSIDPRTTLGIFLEKVGLVTDSGASDSQRSIVLSLRLPRVLVAFLVGGALAVSGTLMQGLFRNPMASPGIIGASTGGALGAILCTVSGLSAISILLLPTAAFLGALGAVTVVYLIAARRGRTPISTLILSGIAVNAALGALISLVITVALSNRSWDVGKEAFFWMMGGLESRTWQHVWMSLPIILAASVASQFFARELNILITGEETALSLGVDVNRLRVQVLTLSALLTGAAVAVSGVVGFVGLIIPHILRLLVGPDHRPLIPTSFFAGGIFLILVDLLARTIVSPGEIRLGILTALLGAPFFAYLLVTQGRKVEFF